MTVTEQKPRMHQDLTVYAMACEVLATQTTSITLLELSNPHVVTLSCHLGHTVNTALLRSRSAVDKRGLLALLPFLGLASCAAQGFDAL